MLDIPNDFDTCPSGPAMSNLPPVDEVGLAGSTFGIDFETLVLLATGFELEVTDDLGPWSVHRIQALDVSACSSEMDPYTHPNYFAEFDSVFGLLGSRAVVSARSVVSQGGAVDQRTMATAITVLALDHVGELPEGLEAASTGEDKFLTDRYSNCS